MAFADRQARVRVFEELERIARHFKSDDDMWPIRVPRAPVSLDALVARALPDGHERFDIDSLRAKTLLHLWWHPSSVWEVWVIVLPSGLKLFCDDGPDGRQVLASGGRHANLESERLFLQLFAESAGELFGIEMSGGAPDRVRSSLEDRAFLVEVFVHLFEVSRAETSVREQLSRTGARVSADNEALGRDFRHEVELWLDHALRA